MVDIVNPELAKKWMEQYAAWNEQARAEMTVKGFDPEVWSYYENGQISRINGVEKYNFSRTKQFKNGIVTPWKESVHYVEI
jgi:hypothetical protein